MADKGKKTIAEESGSEIPMGFAGLGIDPIRSFSSSVNETSDQLPPSTMPKSGSHQGDVFANEIQPLWKGIEIVTKDGSAGGGNVRFQCKFCKSSFVGSYTRVKAHLLKMPGFGIRVCNEIPADDYFQFQKLQEQADAKKSSSVIVSTFISAKGTTDKKRKSENTLEACFKSYGRAKLDKLAGKFFYSSCIPFNVARNPHWIRFVSEVAKSNIPSYLPPSSEKLRTSILADEKDYVEQCLASTKFRWNKIGVSIVSYGWTDIQRCPLINFIAIANDEPVFLRSIDASGEYKDAAYLKSLFKEIIEEVGPNKIVQIITDNAPVCRSAGMSLRNEYPHIFWTPCVAHTLDLALKDICTPPNEEKDPRGYELFSWIEALERDAKAIRNFVVNHQLVLTLFEKFSELKLLNCAETRFASIIITLKRLLVVKSALTKMVAYDDWRIYRAEDEVKARAIKSIIVNDTWWDKLTYFLEFTEPIWCMLREIDKDAPLLHKVYEMWDNMIEKVQSIVFKHEKKCVAFEKSEFFDRIYKILVARWDKSNTPLHCMAHSLNPKYYTKSWLQGGPGRVSPDEDKEIANGRLACLERLCPERDIKNDAAHEYSKFIVGKFESKEIAVAREDENVNPFVWWATYGSEMPILRKIAMKLLSQPVASSCCERNWSTYSHIHNIKRNKLTSKHAKDLVYVHSNLRLLSRKEKDYSCGSSRYWDVDPEAFDFEGDRNLYTANLDVDDPIIPSYDVEFNDEDN